MGGGACGQGHASDRFAVFLKLQFMTYEAPLGPEAYVGSQTTKDGY